MAKMKLKKGDKVIVLVGKDRGKTGEVIKSFPKESKLLVSGVNEAKKHQRPTRASSGGIVTKAMPIHVSNVAFYDEKAKKATKVGFKILENGEKKRIAKNSGEIIG